MFMGKDSLQKGNVSNNSTNVPEKEKTRYHGVIGVVEEGWGKRREINFKLFGKKYIFVIGIHKLAKWGKIHD